MIKVNTRDQTIVSMEADKVKKALEQLFALFKEYRGHEASALLLEEFKEKLNESKRIIASLEACIDRCQSKIILPPSTM